MSTFWCFRLYSKKITESANVLTVTLVSLSLLAGSIVLNNAYFLCLFIYLYCLLFIHTHICTSWKFSVFTPSVVRFSFSRLNRKTSLACYPVPLFLFTTVGRSQRSLFLVFDVFVRNFIQELPSQPDFCFLTAGTSFIRLHSGAWKQWADSEGGRDNHRHKSGKV